MSPKVNTIGRTKLFVNCMYTFYTELCDVKPKSMYTNIFGNILHVFCRCGAGIYYYYDSEITMSFALHVI